MNELAALLLIAPGLVLCGGCVALCLGRTPRACLIASLVTVPASFAGLAAALAALWQGIETTVFLPWPLPLGSCRFSLDPLASAFLIPVFLISAVTACVLPARATLFEDQTHLGRHCFFFCLLSASMALVIQAADAFFFLLLWEVMSLAPFFLLAANDKNASDRYASWIYLAAAHLGALPLLLFFCALASQAGFSNFDAMMLQGHWQHSTLLFFLALIGFGAKSGLFPLHIWMPEAYASPPGHVAALLSGAMVNMGLYGIMRSMCLLGNSPDWAYILLIVGAVSGVMGIVLALVQADIKRTLAYSSAENMGIVMLALGGALLALRHHAALAFVLLLLGALLHIWNHSLCKSLLFLAVNTVKESASVTTLQRLGGLGKRMPLTGGCFATGSAAIAGVPPLNGFLGELLMYLGFAFGAGATSGTEAAFVFWIAFFVLGAIAGFSLYAFTRVYGLAFLGVARSPEAMQAHDPERALRLIMLILAFACLGVSFAGPLLLELFMPLINWFMLRVTTCALIPANEAPAVAAVLDGYALAACAVPLLFGLCWLLRYLAVRRNGSVAGPTWGCGYAVPSSRIQYTGGSFSLSAALLLKPLIRPKFDSAKPDGLFPDSSRARLTTPDWPTAAWTRMVFRPIAFVAEHAKDVQHGHLNLYILYILVALMAALVWALGVA